MHTPPVQLLKNQWNHFIATHGPDENFYRLATAEELFMSTMPF